MAYFTYEAKDGPTRNIRGTIEAPTKESAVERILDLGCTPIKVFECKPGKKSKGKTKRLKALKPLLSMPAFARMPKSKEITVFTQQLSSLLKSGVPIIKSIRIISGQTQNVLFKTVLDKITSDISSGETFSSSLERFPDLFPKLYVSMAKAGEHSGKLHFVLLKIAGYRRREEESGGKTRTAMVYPMLMGAVGIATIVFMLVFVMPRITHLFSELGQSLPTPTRVVIWISSLLREKWYWMLLVVLAMMIFLKQFSKTEIKRRMVSFLGLYVPVVKNFVKMVEFSRFSRTMELLIKSGIPILRTLELAIPTVQNHIIRGKLSKCYGEVEKGASLGKTLEKLKILPPFMVNLIIVAEESGKFDDVFEEIADTYERDTDEALKVLISFLEPVMILTMGLVVGFVVIAMLLPIFEINFMAQ